MRKMRKKLSAWKHRTQKRKTGLGKGMHALHGVHMRVSGGGHRIRQAQPWKAQIYVRGIQTVGRGINRRLKEFKLWIACAKALKLI